MPCTYKINKKSTSKWKVVFFVHFQNGTCKEELVRFYKGNRNCSTVLEITARYFFVKNLSLLTLAFFVIIKIPASFLYLCKLFLLNKPVSLGVTIIMLYLWPYFMSSVLSGQLQLCWYVWWLLKMGTNVKAGQLTINLSFIFQTRTSTTTCHIDERGLSAKAHLRLPL